MLAISPRIWVMVWIVALHHFFALLRRMIGIIGSPRRIGGMASNLLGGGGHLVHGRCHLIGAFELFAGALAHQAGDGIELTAGTVQLRGTALQGA
ncbi:hypothetical protein [Pseudomonas beijingensis]|uniref:hypothetical protein n=1 Tax=Pseudomonas beijingensis TaxID=2954101 RepID=UPI003F73F83E